MKSTKFLEIEHLLLKYIKMLEENKFPGTKDLIISQQ